MSPEESTDYGLNPVVGPNCKAPVNHYSISEIILHCRLYSCQQWYNILLLAARETVLESVNIGGGSLVSDIDPIDLKLFKELSRDARQPYIVLSGKSGGNPVTTRRRAARLIDVGVVRPEIL